MLHPDPGSAHGGIRILGRVTEPAVIASFLRAELGSDRWKGVLHELLEADQRTSSVVTSPDLDSPKQNNVPGAAPRPAPSVVAARRPVRRLPGRCRMVPSRALARARSLRSLHRLGLVAADLGRHTSPVGGREANPERRHHGFDGRMARTDRCSASEQEPAPGAHRRLATRPLEARSARGSRSTDGLRALSGVPSGIARGLSRRLRRDPALVFVVTRGSQSRAQALRPLARAIAVALAQVTRAGSSSRAASRSFSRTSTSTGPPVQAQPVQPPAAMSVLRHQHSMSFARSSARSASASASS
jgi:hypothetical protein